MGRTEKEKRQKLNKNRASRIKRNKSQLIRKKAGNVFRSINFTNRFIKKGKKKGIPYKSTK